MKRFEYEMRFLTPAFLGNAKQNAQWRTPPIKSLLRQWWRVAYAADQQFHVNPAEMRREEGRLFGAASDSEGDSRKSQVRIRLDRWDEGNLKKEQWRPLNKISHPEVAKPVYSDLYLGFGPVTLPRNVQQPTLKANAAIQSGEHATLSIAIPENYAPRIERALWLMDRYGTLGGRSRNGWGSFSLLPLPSGEGWGEGAKDKLPIRAWSDCLAFDWPHALGQDHKGALIWQTDPRDNWTALMETLAIVKIGLRHWISYPITYHTTKAFNLKNARLPNTLRFKVRPAPNDPKKLIGVIFHVPCLPPNDFFPNRQAIEKVWQSVHGLLDELAAQRDARHYETIKNPDRCARLKPQLDTVTLTRIPE